MKNLGQLFIHGLSGLKLTQNEKTFLKKEQIGGIILFKHNYDSPGQIAELVNEIQSIKEDLPFFIGVDQEGGRVVRFKSPFLQLPPMLKLGEINSPKLTFDLHVQVAKELSACGINLNFSPCADILRETTSNAIGDRSFGHESEIVSKHVTAVIRALQNNNVLACVKHFPGHGGTSKDSHFDLPYIKLSKEEFFNFDIIPFEKAIKSRVEFVMMAHLVVDFIDENNPCTLSSKAYQILRKELKFKKIIITDDMEMKALSNRFSYGESALMALKAGADMLCYRTMEKAQEAYEGVLASAQKGLITQTEIDEKNARIKECKINYLKNVKPIYVPSIQDQIANTAAQDLLKILEKKGKTEAMS